MNDERRIYDDGEGYAVYCEEAAALIEEATMNRVEESTSFVDLLTTMPEALEVAIHYIMDGFDYQGNRQSGRAVCCRILAAMLVAFTSHLEQVSPMPEPSEEAEKALGSFQG